MRELTVTRQLATPVNFIVHSLMDVNDQLARGRPFFADIARDGIALYEAPGQRLAVPRQLDAQERHAEARAHYDKWLPDAAYCLTLAEYAIRDGETGLIVGRDDPQAFADAVARLLRNEALRQSMGEAAQRFVREERSIERAGVIVRDAIAALRDGARGAA